MWSDCHCPPVQWSPWVPEARERPRGTRDPALGARYVMDALPKGAVTDPRSPRDVFGAPTRMDARTEACLRR